jgi:hypothetical protein
MMTAKLKMTKCDGSNLKRFFHHLGLAASNFNSDSGVASVNFLSRR